MCDTFATDCTLYRHIYMPTVYVVYSIQPLQNSSFDCACPYIIKAFGYNFFFMHANLRQNRALLFRLYSMDRKKRPGQAPSQDGPIDRNLTGQSLSLSPCLRPMFLLYFVPALSKFWKYNCPRCFSPFFAFPASDQQRTTSLTNGSCEQGVFVCLLGFYDASTSQVIMRPLNRMQNEYFQGVPTISSKSRFHWLNKQLTISQQSNEFLAAFCKSIFLEFLRNSGVFSLK